MSINRDYRSLAQRTAFDKHGLEYTLAVRDELLRKIKRGRGDAQFVKAQSNNRSVWEVKHNDKVYPVVYDRRRKEIVKFLTDREMFIELLRE